MKQVLDSANNRIPDKLAAFDKRVLDTVEQVRQLTGSAANSASELLEEYKNEIEYAVRNDCWHTIFPGKALLADLAQELGLKSDVGFVNSLIKEMAASEEFVDAELLQLRNTILAGNEFTTPPITIAQR